MTESNPINPESTGADREDNWQPCAPGEISGMVTQLQDRRRAVVVGRTTFVAAIVLLVAAVSQFSGLNADPDDVADKPNSGEHDCGGILCSDVVAHFEAFRTGTLDEETTAEVRAHLEECPLCGPKFRKLTGDSAGLDRGTARASLAMTGFDR
ncbi:MAG: zf-HC2 domain-containing protein [Planctomycetes bacterium]|nr:zf-HC2 domain-containing protein [Planctomycetota bacterium]